MENGMRRSGGKRLNAETQRRRGAERGNASVFKETEIGLLPAEWDVVRLGEVSQLNLGRTPRRSEVERYWTDGVIPWVTIGDLNNGYVNYTKEKVSQQAFKDVFKGRIVPQGSLLLSFKLTIGKVGILLMDAVHNEAIVSFELDPQALRDFLFFLFQHVDYDAYLDTYLKGKTLNKRKLKVFPVPLPPLPEQRRIARALRTIQEAIAAQEDVIAAARELKRSLMERLFTYGPGEEPAPTKETEIGDIPEHWELRTVEQIAEVKTSTSSIPDSGDQGPNGTPGEIKLLYLKVSDFNAPGNWKWLNSSQQIVWISPGRLSGLSTVPPESLVFPKRGAAIRTNKKRLTRHHSLLDPNLIAVIPSNRVDYRYLFNWFETFNLADIIDVTPIPQLNKKDVAPLLFPIAPISEQCRIAEAAEALDGRIETEEQRRAALEELFRSALEQLMTGQIRLNAGKET
jgi:type I restriction enzyme S subunit